MSKLKTLYTCTNCQYGTPKWLGCCPECNEWNSFVESTPQTITQTVATSQTKIQLKRLSEVSSRYRERLQTGIHEWDRVLGGGIMPGSFILLTGDPGIGKSTLLLQIAYAIAQGHKVIYFSSEESLEQVKSRAERTIGSPDNLLFADTAEIESIIATAVAEKPILLIIDSIQNCYFAQTQAIPGSVGQLRESGFRFMRLAKENNIALIATGHITKEGVIAGPKTLEHMVDAVFYLQGEDRWETRILRSVKNRFGAVHEVGFFQMGHDGLVEMADINEKLVQEASFSPGSSLISYTEGSRPILLELQALTIPSKFGVPQRVITGADHKQVMLIAAILEKYLGVRFSTQDIFFKVSGGFKIKESSADLGIALALLSSYFQQPLPQKSLTVGEMSLTGNIKAVNELSIHLQEAVKFGIQTLLTAETQKIKREAVHSLRQFSNVYELLTLFDINSNNNQ
jgi:DNA repair protein RadA/Sms